MKNNTKYTETPIRVAVLVDAGYFIKRYQVLYNKDRARTAEQIVNDLYTICMRHVGNNNYLYRIFYYDCVPFSKKVHNPISGLCVDFAKTPEACLRNAIFMELKKKRKVALRLGQVKDSGNWEIRPRLVKSLLKGEIGVSDLKDDDIVYALRQKGIDMKIGVDIASLALKHFVDKIVLIAGDSDFVPAAKLARREGIDFVLNPMFSIHVEESLYEHIDGLESISLSNMQKKKKHK